MKKISAAIRLFHHWEAWVGLFLAGLSGYSGVSVGAALSPGQVLGTFSGAEFGGVIGGAIGGCLAALLFQYAARRHNINET
jgi:hypothetical protein